MRVQLYQKVFIWFVLNLLLLMIIAAGVLGFLLFKGSNGLLPPYLFSSNVETSFRAISANLQYKPVDEWAAILKQYTHNSPHQYTLFALDGDIRLGPVPPLPKAVLAAAGRMPRMPFTLCPDPTVLDLVGNMPYGIYEVYGYEDALNEHYQAGIPPKDFESMEAGIPPQPRVIYMRAGDPARYWFGQAVFIPDETKTLRYMLMAVSSSSFSGNGLFFDTQFIGSLLLLVIGIACLWWWPFIMHVTKPIIRMADVAESLANDEGKLPPISKPGTNICAVRRTRKDEIGRLAEAIDSMARQISGILSGQRVFIHHVAHELNSPLARIKLGLAVLENRLDDGDSKQRVQRILEEMEKLSRTTDDIITFLRSQGSDQIPRRETLNLSALVSGVVAKEGAGRNIFTNVAQDIFIQGDDRFVERALANILRNAVKYSEAGREIAIEAFGGHNSPWVTLEVRDSGRGVSDEELKMLAEPFFRGNASQQKSGVGLGLYIAQYCIEACGGKLEFQRNTPKGLIARIKLEQASSAAEQSPT